MNASSKTDPVKFGYYCVALIDVLNQKDALRRFKELPRSEEEMNEFIRIAKETFGVIDGIRNLFDSFYSSFIGQKVSSPLDELMKTELKFQRFSDTIIIYVSLASNGNSIPISGVYAALLACGSIFLYSMAAGHPLRGGIEVGMAAEIYEGEIYGPALSEAYRLESEIAQYPRIAVGNELVSYLMDQKRSNEPELRAKFNRGMAEYCLSFLTQDVDGYPIVDYLGEGFVRAANYDRRDGEAFSKAYQFIMQEIERWRKQRNTQLAFRYTHLKNYFAARRALWKDSLTEEESRKL